MKNKRKEERKTSTKRLPYVRCNAPLAVTHPHLVAEWHPTKNGDLTPDTVTANSDMRVWWICSHGHEWQAVIGRRRYGYGCPICSGLQVLKGFNDLATTHPELAAEWHPTKNGDLTPDAVTRGSQKRVWGLCKHGHEWQSIVLNRTRGHGCPYCSIRAKALAGFNDLATMHPSIAAEWHPTLNGDLTPQNVTAKSNRIVWWRCAEGHEWQHRIRYRTSHPSVCPYCADVKALAGYNDIATTHPEIAKYWHPTKNGALTSQMVTYRSTQNVWWMLPGGLEWCAPVNQAISCGVWSDKARFACGDDFLDGCEAFNNNNSRPNYTQEKDIIF